MSTNNIVFSWRNKKQNPRFITKHSSLRSPMFSPNIDLLKCSQAIYHLPAHIRILHVYFSLSSWHQYWQDNYISDYKNIRKAYIPDRNCHRHNFKRASQFLFCFFFFVFFFFFFCFYFVFFFVKWNGRTQKHQIDSGKRKCVFEENLRYI